MLICFFSVGGPKIPAPPPPPIGLLSSGPGSKVPLPPPPPPSLSLSFKAPAPIRPALPDYLPPKKKQQVDVSMRKPPVASFTIDPKTISESSFWTRTKEDDLLSSEALDQLKAKFALKPAVRSLASSSETELDVTASVKIKVPQIIHDDKTIQRLGIVQGSVKMSYSGLKKAILQMDESKLTKDLEQLRSALPPADVLAKLAEVSKEQYEEMPEGEQFAAYLATIPSLPLRLDLIQFHMQYKASVDEIKSMMTTVSEACFELQHSEGFAAFLSIVLGMCNYMSASSKSHKDIYAFEMRMLPKLMDTRDIDGRSTLLHHIAQHMRSTLDAQLGRFAAHDMYHCQLAARINPDELQKLVTLLAANIKKLEKFLSNYKSAGEDDRFEEVMRPFLEETNKEQDTIQIMNKKMSSDWTALANYFAFDSNKYKMEEFFNDMKTFKQQFEQVCRDLDKEIADAKRRDETQQKRKALADRQEQANRTGNAEREMDRTSPGRSSIHGDKRLSADASKVSAWDELDSKMLGDASLFGLLSHSRAASRQGLNRVKVGGKHHSIQRQRSRLRSGTDLFGSPSKTISGRIPLRTPNASPSRSLSVRPTSNFSSPPSPSGGPSSSSSTPLRVGIGLPGMSNTEGAATSPVMRVRRKGAPAVPVEDAHLHQHQRQMTSPSHKENLAPGEREEHEQRPNKQDMETGQTETLGRGAEADRQNETIAKLPTAEELIERLSRL
ncbi:hypothetical protein WR25_04078 [Diploscapter pachys]|uniref:FH2 domain-containing protein n=1 Tax=Diploscapter pachys TaxID=2018661 RepID=A0A2A2J5L3_9BILA|nr:hypothetical protein WR25_04078 [Diploscapter pachys]